MKKRFSENKNRRKLVKESSDFHYRKHGPSLILIGFIFMAILLLTLYLINDLITTILYWPGDEELPAERITGVMAMVVLSAIAAGIFAIYMIYRVRENMLEAQFQNMIFASSMRVNSDFCLVVHRERTGVYCDYNFSKLFKKYEHIHDPFHKLMASEGFSDKDEKKLLKALKKGEGGSFKFKLKNNKGKKREMSVSLFPLERPEGFFLLKGHE